MTIQGMIGGKGEQVKRNCKNWKLQLIVIIQWISMKELRDPRSTTHIRCLPIYLNKFDSATYNALGYGRDSKKR